ncbi:MAG TPA: FtsQ-type POTRA domain-containing protein [Kineosporiaceae bacterium]|nr:FtsQ-type POTRA domain-containing protein [Kineosporiaceae bacterium]
MAAGSRPPNPRPVKRAASAAKGTAARGTSTGKASAGKPAGRTGAAKQPAGKPSAAKQSAAKQGAAKPGAVKGFAHGPMGRTAGRPVRNSVSLTSAQRFAARVRARRRRRVLIVIAVVLVLNGLLWVALKSPWATVQKIEVSGTDRISVATVRAEAEVELGHPMLLARTADIADRVGRQRLVRSVRVERHWPSTIRVHVQERVPVAALPAGSSLSLVDRDGVEVERVKTAPAGLPRLEVDRGAASVPALRGSLAVLQALPSTLSQRLLAIGADSPDGIWLQLRDSKVPGGARVEWGDSAQTRRKARVLTALLPQHAVGYDVRSPDTPAVRRK